MFFIMIPESSIEKSQHMYNWLWMCLMQLCQQPALKVLLKYFLHFSISDHHLFG